MYLYYTRHHAQKFILEEYIGEYIDDFGISKDLLNNTQRNY